MELYCAQTVYFQFNTVLGMLESREQEFKIHLSKEQEDLSTAKAQLQRLTEREAALAHQNAKMSVDLVAADKRHQSLQEELVRVKKELVSKETELSSAREELKSKLDRSSTEIDMLKKTSTEQSKIIKEYQDKVLTSAVQKSYPCHTIRRFYVA